MKARLKLTIVIAGFAAAAVALLAAGWLGGRDDNARNAGQNSNPAAAAESPAYQTVLPGGKSIDQLGGWKRVSPPESDPVFAYIDAIGDYPISVSQQPLPAPFKNNSDSHVAELAKKFNATTKVDAGGTSVYIGTSAKGPQSVIFTKHNALVLIKSQEKISNDAWAAYVASLR